MIKSINYITLLLLILTSCTSEQAMNSSSAKGNSLFPVPTSEEDLFSADPDLKDYIPADSNEIQLVLGSNDPYSIEYGYSFGECLGFCEKKIILSSNGALLTSRRWEDDVIITIYHPLTNQEYDGLLATMNFDGFIDFNENLGCGDCADGGSEYIKIKKDGETHSIQGTYGYKCPPVDSLLNYFRKLAEGDSNN